MKNEKWQVNLYIDNKLYIKYKQYLQENFDISTAGCQSKIRAISEELFEDMICSTLVGKKNNIIKEVLDDAL